MFSRSLRRATASKRCCERLSRHQRSRHHLVTPSRSSNKRCAPPSDIPRVRQRRSLSDTTITTEQCAKELEELATQSAWQETLARQLTAAQRQQVSKLLQKVTAREVPEPTMRDLQLVALNVAIPFVGFGIMDNAILIIAGDAIDTSLGVALGISTMCAAAIGNIVSDLAGVLLGTVIEDATAKYLNLPQPNLSAAQRQLRSVRYSSQAGCAIGIVIGCIIGMFPLLFLDSNKTHALKRERHLDTLFRDVMTETKWLVGAQRTCLFLLVNPPDPQPDETSGQVVLGSTTKLAPDANGKYLYAKYGAIRGKDQKYEEDKSKMMIPLGRGIISRAALTGRAWKIDDVHSEPDFLPKLVPLKNVRNMVCVPVLDSRGRAIAVIQAVNKIEKGLSNDPDIEVEGSGQYQAFTNGDVQVLKALASHVSVSLQRLYEADEGEEAEVRLKDTIRILRDHGLEGITDDEDRTPVVKRRPLFPEDEPVAATAAAL